MLIKFAHASKLAGTLKHFQYKEHQHKTQHAASQRRQSWWPENAVRTPWNKDSCSLKIPSVPHLSSLCVGRNSSSMPRSSVNLKAVSGTFMLLKDIRDRWIKREWIRFRQYYCVQTVAADHIHTLNHRSSSQSTVRQMNNNIRWEFCPGKNDLATGKPLGAIFHFSKIVDYNILSGVLAQTMMKGQAWLYCLGSEP